MSKHCMKIQKCFDISLGAFKNSRPQPVGNDLCVVPIITFYLIIFLKYVILEITVIITTVIISSIPI